MGRRCTGRAFRGGDVMIDEREEGVRVEGGMNE